MAEKAPKTIHAVGKRKTSVARVWMQSGSGKVTINRMPFDEYLKRATSQMIVRQPFAITERDDKYDVLVNVKGGGLSGQAEAIRHGIAKALSEAEPEQRTILKQAGLIRRDARIKERKLPGQPGARKRFQFSKR